MINQSQLGTRHKSLKYFLSKVLKFTFKLNGPFNLEEAKGDCFRDKIFCQNPYPVPDHVQLYFAALLWTRHQNSLPYRRLPSVNKMAGMICIFVYERLFHFKVSILFYTTLFE